MGTTPSCCKAVKAPSSPISRSIFPSFSWNAAIPVILKSFPVFAGKLPAKNLGTEPPVCLPPPVIRTKTNSPETAQHIFVSVIEMIFTLGYIFSNKRTDGMECEIAEY